MLVAKGPGAKSMLADIVKYLITLLRTGVTGLVKTHTEQKSTELFIGGLSRIHSQSVHGYSFVLIGCNPRLFRVLEARGNGTPLVDIGSLATLVA